ncbi:cytochrome P450 [Phellopilus nigrolimitatus]|nr:cytochrome P450 [Phellopilus nigrolimitatus]
MTLTLFDDIAAIKLAISSHIGFSLLALAICVLTLSWISSKKSQNSRHNFFPGPPAEPILGHLRIMPTEFQWRTFADWGKTFGDVIYTNIIGHPIIILNSAEGARDLMEKRSANYSDRPISILHGDMLNLKYMLPNLPYGDRSRTQRRLMQQYLSPQAVNSLRPLQAEQVRILLKNLLDFPEEFRHHINQMSSASLVKFTYGHDIVSGEDKFVNLAIDATSRGTAAGIPGMTPVDLFPILRHIPTWFPGAGFKREALITRKLSDMVTEVPFNKVKEERASGTAQTSLVNNLLEDYENLKVIDEDHEINIKRVGSVVYAAGVDTTEVTLMSFILMMARNPNVLKRAQVDIDKVVGVDRLPTMEDRTSLPYIDCILKEVFRINPAVPLSLPHRSRKEDIYRDKVIPAGSMIVPNVWQMMKDERYFPSPEMFSPERHLKKVETQIRNGGADFSTRSLNGFEADDPSSLAFGFGRRICPGRFFADTSIWLAIANILTVFDILPPIDPDTGKETMPLAEYSFGFTSKPKPFKCRIIPRSAKHITLIDQD